MQITSNIPEYYYHLNLLDLKKVVSVTNFKFLIIIFVIFPDNLDCVHHESLIKHNIIFKKSKFSLSINDKRKACAKLYKCISKHLYKISGIKI